MIQIFRSPIVCKFFFLQINNNMSKQLCRVSIYIDRKYTDKTLYFYISLYTNTITGEKFHYIIVLLAEREQ